MVPSDVRKYINGWSNYSCKVISHKSSEKNMGYRGSKSCSENGSELVKEQRVNSSLCANGKKVVILLTGLFLNYQVRIPTKSNLVINKSHHGRLFTSIAVQQDLTSNLIINPWFVTGFSDAEGCFTLSVIKSNESKIGWRVFRSFAINIHKKDKALLEQIQSYFGGAGSITKQTSETTQYRVQSIKKLTVILNHFDKYPLITRKWADYKLFKQAFTLIQNKEHLTMEGLSKIVAIKASMNLGLPKELKAAFPDVTPVQRPNVLDCRIKDPNWLAGFSSGEGCFYIRISKSSLHKQGFSVVLSFELAQHKKDELL